MILDHLIHAFFKVKKKIEMKAASLCLAGYRTEGKGLAESELRSESGQRKVCKVRHLLCQFAMRKMGYAGAAISLKPLYAGICENLRPILVENTPFQS
jgi:hypothetical protein